ncbi:MAG: chromosomal replication initiator protein DnaA [Oscillospiraceae bacterium]|nr:chromosomal replication initiator protein DnaA [Oscillospiraceae bacterium]
MAYPDEMKEIWELVKDSFRGECASTVFELWYGAITPSNFDPVSNELTFDTESEFKLPLLEKNYKGKIEERFATVAGMEVTVTFRFIGKPVDAEALRRRVTGQTSSTPEVAPTPEREEDPLDAHRAKFTFDNFIEGESNHFARAVCMRVAAKPYDVHNPLFLYGPSGVGKTHLMCAVVNELRRQRPNTKVIYTTMVDFVNYMVKCISRNDMETFRSYYRGCDVLLLDDVQFIAGKESTQLEVFNTFNTLFDEGKQIILASDRPPKDINPLEERLRSRFEQGLLADINPPDMELRVAIIRKKAEYLNIDLPDEVLSFLAENLRSNIRQIEGSIKKLAAKSLIDGRRISLEMAKDCISDLLGDAEPLNVTIDKIFAAVYKKYNVSKEELVGKKRNKEIAYARHITIYLLREITEMSFPNISKVINKDPSTVQSSCNIIKTRMTREPLFESDIESLKRDITGH